MMDKLAAVSEIVSQCRSEAASDVNSQLEWLIEKFTFAVRAIDPTIENVWVGRNGEDFKTPFFIHIERADSRFPNRRAD